MNRMTGETEDTRRARMASLEMKNNIQSEASMHRVRRVDTAEVTPQPTMIHYALTL